MTTSVWFGLMAPAATPREIVAKINTDVHAILSSQEARERLIADGQERGPRYQFQFAFAPDCAMIRAETSVSLRRNSAKAAGVLPISS